MLNCPPDIMSMFGALFDHLIECDKRKTKCHELDDRPQTDHGRADAKTGKAVFADRRIDDSFRTKPFEQTLADFVSAVVFRDFFAHQKHVRVALQFFRERLIQSLAISDLPHSVEAAVPAADPPDFAGDSPAAPPSK